MQKYLLILLILVAGNALASSHRKTRPTGVCSGSIGLAAALRDQAVMVADTGDNAYDGGDIPLPGSLTTGRLSAVNLERDLDNLLTMSWNELKDGITGYGINIAKAISMQVLDELVESIANATVFAPIATEIMAAYEKIKSNSLAESIIRVKSVMRDALSRQLKLRYQAYKVAFEKRRAHQQPDDVIANSITEQQTQAGMDELYGGYAGVMNEFYNSPEKNALVNADDPNMGYALFQSSAGLADNTMVKARLALANERSTATEAIAVSPYERIRMKQKALQTQQDQQAALVKMRRAVHEMVGARLYQKSKKLVNPYYRRPSQN